MTARLGSSAGMALVWADEFDGAGLPDPARWTYDTERNRAGWHNGERQYYAANRPRNARVEQGRLIIEAHEERLDDRPDHGGQAFSSSRLTTRSLASWNYGFIEVRAKFPCVRGAWPAIWLLPANRAPDFANGEIDIVEHVGHQPGLAHHSVHTGSRNFRRGNHRSAVSRVPSACEAFHDYQLRWTADEIVIGVDGRAAFSYKRREPEDWPFDGPFYLIVNLAVGGEWAGSRGIDAASFPARLEIDHIRVYAPS